MDFNVKEITQQDGFIYAYSDGGYSDKTKKIGSGVAVATQDINAPNELKSSIHKNDADPNLDKRLRKIYNSSNFQRASCIYYAEYMAAIMAFEKLPAGSSIRYHTDENAVFNTISTITGSSDNLLTISRGNPEKV